MTMDFEEDEETKASRSRSQALRQKFSCAMEVEWRYGMEIPKKEPALPQCRQLSEALNRELDLAFMKRRPDLEAVETTVVGKVDLKKKKSMPPKRRRSLSYHESAGPDKARCGLCHLFFSKESVSGITCNKHILAFRSARGITVSGRRFETPSFLYQRAHLCVFCSQLDLISSRDTIQPQYDASSPVRKSFFVAGTSSLPSEGSNPLQRLSVLPKAKYTRRLSSASAVSARTELDALIAEEARRDGIQDIDIVQEDEINNLARAKPAMQSSSADGTPAYKAIDSNGIATKCEYEPWWEVDLSANYAIKSIHIGHNRGEQAFIFLTAEAFGQVKLNQVKKKAIYYTQLQEDAATTTWQLPQKAHGKCLRVQARGFRSLRLKNISVEESFDDESSSSQGLDAFMEENLLHRRDSYASTVSEDDTETIVTKERCRPLTGGGTHTRGYARGRTILTRQQKPTNVELSLTQSQVLGSTAALLRRGKSAHDDFNAFPVDQLYWRTLLRYERIETTACQVRILEASFLPRQLEWLESLFGLCRDHDGKGPEAAALILAGIGEKRGAAQNSTKDIVNHQNSVTSSNISSPSKDSKSASKGGRGRASFDDLSLPSKILEEHEDDNARPSGAVLGEAVYFCLREVAAHLTRVERTWLRADAVQTVTRELGRITGIDENEVSLKALAQAALMIPKAQQSTNGRRCSVFLCEDPTNAEKASLSPSITKRRTSSACIFPNRGLCTTASVQSHQASHLKKNDAVLEVHIRWSQFLALFALIRDRSLSGKTTHEGIMDEVARALELELDFRAVDPVAAERRHVARVSSARPASRQTFQETKSLSTFHLQKNRRLLLSQARFQHVANRSTQETNLSTTLVKQKETKVASSEYVQSLERRREKWREFEQNTKKQKACKLDLKACALCQYEFSPLSLAAEVSQENIFQLLQVFGVDENDLVGRGIRRIGTASSRTLRQPVCRFCAQFFDPDNATGLAPRPDTDNLKYYEPFFDDRFPNCFRHHDANKTTEPNDGTVHFTATLKKQRASSARAPPSRIPSSSSSSSSSLFQKKMKTALGKQSDRCQSARP